MMTRYSIVARKKGGQTALHERIKYEQDFTVSIFTALLEP